MAVHDRLLTLRVPKEMASRLEARAMREAALTGRLVSTSDLLRRGALLMLREPMPTSRGCPIVDAPSGGQLCLHCRAEAPEGGKIAGCGR